MPQNWNPQSNITSTTILELSKPYELCLYNQTVVVIIQYFHDDELALTDHSEPRLSTEVGGRLIAYLMWAQITERNAAITLNILESSEEWLFTVASMSSCMFSCMPTSILYIKARISCIATISLSTLLWETINVVAYLGRGCDSYHCLLWPMPQLCLLDTDRLSCQNSITQATLGYTYLTLCYTGKTILNLGR